MEEGKEQFSGNIKEASLIESWAIYLDRTGSCPVSSFHGVKALAKSSYHKNKTRQKCTVLMCQRGSRI